METIGLKIKQERTLRKWTQNYLADKIGVTQDSISLWEKDKRLPDTQYIIALCKLFNVSADYILCIEDKFDNIESEATRISNLKNNKTINFNQTITIK